ncbi:unnamed protein product [Knipowitschia caucasica]|uniref:Uncharacterized protein n=1 Tax=Knipowitschia caucasica TaxID=637954 RepID=A0AAV2LI75_KNICA
MLNKVILVCALFTAAGSSLTCRWMDNHFKQYIDSSLDLLKTMKNDSLNSTDVELDDAAAFPNELYRHASRESRRERLSFAAHVLNEIYALFEEDQTHAPWSARVVEDFRDIIEQQANGVGSCVQIGKHTHHRKNHRKMTMYFKKLSRHVLAHMRHSADAWELVRAEVRLHLHRVYLLATS